MSRQIYRLALGASMAGLLLWGAGAGAETLTIGFVERAGYSYLDQGQPKGLMIDVARGILTKSGVAFEFVPLPQNRLVGEVKDGKAQICALGLFKNPDRESFATFTKPIYKNQPIGVLINAANREKFTAIASLAALVDAPGLTLGAVEGFSYGGYVDGLIDKMTGKKNRASVPASQLVTMLAAGRVDYMFADPEEWQALAAAATVDPNSLALLSFPDSPEGNQRYLMCSKAVPAATIDKIDAAITP